MAEYIERNVLLERMKANFQQGSRYGCDEPMYPVVEETILEADAADVSPVVHGRWVNEDFPENLAAVHDMAQCSVCGELSHKSEHGYAILSKFCPNCGAKMDEEVSDGR